ncbi:MAG: hypothetical protein K6A44_07005 [bacterium]|nr:hypothetical protein [bacterium]
MRIAFIGIFVRPTPNIGTVRSAVRHFSNESRLYYYSKANPNFDINTIESGISRKMAGLPWEMQPFFNSTLSYLKGFTDAISTSRKIFKHTHCFFRRINIAQDSQRFNETYPEEIKTIKTIINSFKDFLNGVDSKRQLDANLENSIAAFSQKPGRHRRNFIFSP